MKTRIQEKFENKLKSDFAHAANAYVEYFAEKKGVIFKGWAGVPADVGGIAEFDWGGEENSFFRLDDIRHDIDHDCALAEIFIWDGEQIDLSRGQAMPSVVKETYPEYWMRQLEKHG